MGWLNHYSLGLRQQPSTLTHPPTTFISIRVLYFLRNHPPTTFISIRVLYFLRNISIIYKYMYTILDHSISETVMNLANDNDNI